MKQLKRDRRPSHTKGTQTSDPEEDVVQRDRQLSRIKETTCISSDPEECTKEERSIQKEQLSSIATILHHGRYAKETEATSNTSSESSAQSRDSVVLARDTFNGPSPPGIRMHPSCSGLVLGDSNLKNISQKRLSPSRSTQVRTYRGATTLQMSDILQGTRTADHIKRVVLSVGTIDICKGRNMKAIVDSYTTLLLEAGHTFPEAAIAVAAIPPQNTATKNKIIMAVNKKLQELCDERGVVFLPQRYLWDFVTKNHMREDSSILSDQIHLSGKGLGLFLRDIKAFLFPEAVKKRGMELLRSGERHEIMRGRSATTTSSTSGTEAQNHTILDQGTTGSNSEPDRNSLPMRVPDNIVSSAPILGQSGPDNKSHAAPLQNHPLQYNGNEDVCHPSLSPQRSSMGHPSLPIPHHLPGRKWPEYLTHAPYYPNPFFPPSMPLPYPYPPAWYHGYPPQHARQARPC